MSDLLEASSAASFVASSRVTHFVRQVEGAAAFLAAAHADSKIHIPALRKSPRQPSGATHPNWYSFVVKIAVTHLRDIMIVITTHPAEGAGAAAELEAFKLLTELTTAGPQLLTLAGRDRRLAYRELAKHMEFVRQEFELTAALEERLTATANSTIQDKAAEVISAGDFANVRGALLKRAGGAFSLTEAAAALHITRQALHKRISSGSALGMMVDNEIVVPKLQIAIRHGAATILPGIDAVTKLFRQTDAGPWMALQFLVDPDPNLSEAPIEALRTRDVQLVVEAARAHLHLDEE
jgi:hypothetical protein